MSDQAFPNSEQLFRQAFAAADPAPLLLNLLRDHPIYDTVQELVIYYTEAVEEQPLRGTLLASTLASVSVSPDAPNFETDSLASLINGELADQHFKVIHGDTEVKEYGPKNTYLLESLLSGLSLKYNLTSTSDQLAAIDDGLDAHTRSDKAELLVVGACIQLLFYGSKIVTDAAGSYRKKASSVAQKLKDHKAAGTVKNPHAIQVLELTISNAEAGFKPEDDREDAWALLFPS